jgi:hypothetical protein
MGHGKIVGVADDAKKLTRRNSMNLQAFNVAGVGPFDNFPSYFKRLLPVAH